MSEPLPTIGYISHIVADALRDTTSGINTTQLRAEPNGCVSEPLVFRSEALAKLAEKDAEIARYREALLEAKTFHAEQDKSLSKQPPSSQGSWRRNLHQEQIEQIEVALKGPEACARN